MDKVALGQKLNIYSILVNVIALVAALVASHPRLGIAALVVAGAISATGVVLICKGLGSTTLRTVLLAVLAVPPLINIVVLVVMNSQATTALRLAGYQVGLFGATK